MASSSCTTETGNAAVSDACPVYAERGGGAAAMTQMSELLDWERKHRTEAQAQCAELELQLKRAKREANKL